MYILYSAPNSKEVPDEFEVITNELRKKHATKNRIIGIYDFDFSRLERHEFKAVILVLYALSNGKSVNHNMILNKCNMVGRFMRFVHIELPKNKREYEVCTTFKHNIRDRFNNRDLIHTIPIGTMESVSMRYDAFTGRGAGPHLVKDDLILASLLWLRLCDSGILSKREIFATLKVAINTMSKRIDPNNNSYIPTTKASVNEMIELADALDQVIKNTGK
jgi:hypothetical protein